MQLFNTNIGLLFTKTNNDLPSLNISDLPKGLYILKVNMNDEVSYKRFIKD